MEKVNKATKRALMAVRDGKVTQVYTARGNSFQGPPGVGRGQYRKFEQARWIEDVPGQSQGVYATRVIMRLSKLGREALASV